MLDANSLQFPYTENTAKSKNVVLRKSKIQITKYKIQEKVCHITHTIGLFNYHSVIYTVRGGIFYLVEYFQEIYVYI